MDAILETPDRRHVAITFERETVGCAACHPPQIVVLARPRGRWGPQPTPIPIGRHRFWSRSAGMSKPWSIGDFGMLDRIAAPDCYHRHQGLSGLSRAKAGRHSREGVTVRDQNFLAAERSRSRGETRPRPALPLLAHIGAGYDLLSGREANPTNARASLSPAKVRRRRKPMHPPPGRSCLKASANAHRTCCLLRGSRRKSSGDRLGRPLHQ